MAENKSPSPWNSITRDITGLKRQAAVSQSDVFCAFVPRIGCSPGLFADVARKADRAEARVSSHAQLLTSDEVGLEIYFNSDITLVKCSRSNPFIDGEG